MFNPYLISYSIENNCTNIAEMIADSRVLPALGSKNSLQYYRFQVEWRRVEETRKELEKHDDSKFAVDTKLRCAVVTTEGSNAIQGTWTSLISRTHMHIRRFNKSKPRLLHWSWSSPRHE